VSIILTVKRLGLLRKMVLAYIVFVVVLSGLTLVLFVVSTRVSGLAGRIYLVDYRKKEITDRLIANLIAVEETGKQYIILRNDAYRTILDQQYDDITRAWDILLSGGMTRDETERNVAENGRGLWMAFWVRFNSQLKELPPDQAALDELFARNSSEIDQVVSAARYINRNAVDSLRSNIASLKDLGDEITAWTWWALVLGLSIGLVVPVLLSVSVVRDLNRIKEGIAHISEGDFSYRIDLASTDELGMLAESFNKMASRLKELDEMKSDFISMVSHELKTPLTSMKEAASLLMEGHAGGVSDKQKRLLEIMDQGIRRLLNTVSELLDMSRIASGTIALDKGVWDMNETVAAFVSEIWPIADANGVRIKAVYAEGGCRVLVDRNKILQVLTNLTHNAIKSSPEGSEVEIRVRNTGGCVVTEIEDHGKGIPEEDLPRIFEKFFQSRSTRGHGGMGLGLAISKGIVDAHGGTIYAQSKVGKGSVFAFSLPCADTGLP